jgi:glycosyltransferase involved in cell wall biosynthesis
MSEEKERLYIWTLNKSRIQSACQYYRIRVPLRSLEKMGYAHIFEDNGESHKTTLNAMLSSDIVHYYAMGGADILHQTDVIKGMRPGLKSDRSLHFPPSIIYDTDDNPDFVHPTNPTFLVLGVRSYPDCRLLEPGESLQIIWPDGEKQTLLEDQVTGDSEKKFDIERNLREMKIRHQIIKNCHGATVTTPALASYFKDVIGQPNVHIHPNTVVPSDYKSFKVIRSDPNEIRIFWQGSISHYVDWYPLKEALKEVCVKYPQIKWVIYGTKYDWIHDIIPESMIEYHDWTAYEAYRLHRGILNIDINLCPLADNPFNRCKSAIKWYEASIWDEPEATLAAKVKTYDEIEDGVTGLLYKTPKEFLDKLGILIENTELRKTLAQNSKKWVLDNRTPEKTIPALADFYYDLKERQKTEFLSKLG